VDVWNMKKNEGNIITKKRTLRVKCGKTIKDKISNEKIREITG